MLLVIIITNTTVIRVTKTFLLQGRYTKDIRDYELTIPRRLNSDGEFQSYDIPHFFDHDFANRRRKRSVGDPHSIHYGVTFGGAKHHLELWPNHGFVSSNLLSEIRDPTTKVQNRIMRGLRNKKLCHYTGRVRGISGSKVALSTCDGLVNTLSTYRFLTVSSPHL